MSIEGRKGAPGRAPAPSPVIRSLIRQRPRRKPNLLADLLIGGLLFIWFVVGVSILNAWLGLALLVGGVICLLYSVYRREKWMKERDAQRSRRSAS